MATSLKAGMDHLIGGMQTGPKNIGRVNKFYMLSVKFRSALVETIEKILKSPGKLLNLKKETGGRAYLIGKPLTNSYTTLSASSRTWQSTP